MKRLVAGLLLAATLLVAPVVSTGIVYADPIKQMVDDNYVFRTSDELCSATLFSQEYRWVLTNYHCIEGIVSVVEKEEVQADGTVKKVQRVFYGDVTLSQPAYSLTGKVGEITLNAEVLAFSKDFDLAVLRIRSETTTLPPSAKIPPDSYKLEQGQPVYAVGNPAGLENTVTKGILNNLYREYRWSDDRLARYIQTDATIFAGSSGGALYSVDGFLIGIPSAGYRGVSVNFAVPFDVFKTFLRAAGFARAWDPAAPTRDDFLKAKADEAKKAK